MLNHTLPSRCRRRSDGRVLRSQCYYRWYYFPYYQDFWSLSSEYELPGDRVIFDEKQPRSSYKPCVHHCVSCEVVPKEWTKTVPDPKTIYARTDGTLLEHCPKNSGSYLYMVWGKFYPHKSFAPIPAAIEDQLENALTYDKAHDAVNSVMSDFYDAMTTIRNDLPDMTVFTKELSDFRRAWQQIRQIALSFAQLIESSYGWDYAKRNQVWNTPEGRSVYRRSQKHKKKAKDAIKDPQSYSNAYISVNFGYLAPFRDICAILSELIMKLRSICPDGQTRVEHFSRGERLFEKASPGYVRAFPLCGAYVSQCCDPSATGGCVDTQTLDFKAVVTAEMTSKLTGSNLEKAFAAVLGLLGALPNIDTLWEMTKLSWFVDYFFRIDKLFRLAGLFHLSPVKTIVMQSCCSVSIQNSVKREFKAPCLVGSSITMTDDYYERALDYYPLEDLCSLFTYPKNKEIGLAASMLMQMFGKRK